MSEEVNAQNPGAPVQILDLVEEYSFRNLFRVMRARFLYRRFDDEMSDEITRVNIERNDSVGVLLYDPDEDVVVLTRQFRYPVFASIEADPTGANDAGQAWFLEIAAGVIDPGYGILETAIKEVLEETGYEVEGRIHSISTIYTSPGWTSERIHLFLGIVNHRERSISPVSSSAEEDIQVEYLTLQAAMRSIERGEITDAKTVIALQYLDALKSSGMES